MNTRRAFTLVELLTVITIIGILVTLVTVAVSGARKAAQRTKMATQMAQISMAIDRYKAEFDEFPPDLFDDDALVRHVKKRWPRLNWQKMQPAANQADQIRITLSEAFSIASDKNVDFTQPGAQVGSLAIWLGGFPNSDGKLSGFYADPENPFIPSGAFDNNTFIDLEFGEDKNVRLFPVGNASVPVIGNEIRDTFVPIVYFRGKSSGGDEAYKKVNGDIKDFDFSEQGLGWCVPYAEDFDVELDVIKWKHPTNYQLIHPGFDCKFGETDSTVLRVIKSTDGIDSQDLDNLTNFSEYKELKSILP